MMHGKDSHESCISQLLFTHAKFFVHPQREI